VEVAVNLLEGSAEDDCPGCSILLDVYRHYELDGEEETVEHFWLESRVDNGQRFAVDLKINPWNMIIGLSVAPGKELYMRHVRTI
jgi:hypothetical protein